MPVREPSRPAAPPLSVGGARIVVRPGGHGAGLRPAAAVPVPDDAFTVTAEREGLWRLDAAVAVPQPPDRAARFQEQDTLDPDLALDAAVMFPGGAPHGPFLCLYQHKEWWMRPAWRDALADVPERTQMILWRDDDAWTALVAVCGDDARADLHGDALAVGTVRAVDDARDADAAAAVPASGLRIALSSNRVGRTALADVAAYLAVAADPYDAIRACVDAAAKRLGIATADRRPLPEALSGFGWCTWDSLGRDVGEAAIVGKMEEFRAKHIPVSWVMIDDGWSRTDREAETLIGLDADPERFPHGLAHTADLLRERYGVRHVGVWAAFQGYWNGLEPGGPAVAQIGTGQLTTTANGCLIPGPGRRQALMFWMTWLSLLRGMGVDCVKIDSQSSTSTMTRGAESYGEATVERHAALDRVAESEMGGALINCMGMAPEDYWHRPLSAVTRTSDDFLPHDPSSLAEHLTQNAYCALLMGELYRCDWDMFWSEHPHARTHALMRALSGGPVYCSDAAGRSDPSVLEPLTLPDGRVPHPDHAAVPVADALLADPTSADRAWCVATRSGGWHLLAFVGLNPDRAQDIRLRDALRGLPGTTAAERAAAGWWVVDAAARTARHVPAAGPMDDPAADDGPSPTLPYGESRLYYAMPASAVRDDRDGDGRDDASPVVRDGRCGDDHARDAASRGRSVLPDDMVGGGCDGIVPVGLIGTYLAPAGIVEVHDIPRRSAAADGLMLSELSEPPSPEPMPSGAAPSGPASHHVPGPMRDGAASAPTSPTVSDSGTDEPVVRPSALAVTLAGPGAFAFLDPERRCRGVLSGGVPVPVERHGALAVADCPSADAVLLLSDR